MLYYIIFCDKSRRPITAVTKCYVPSLSEIHLDKFTFPQSVSFNVTAFLPFDDKFIT